MQIITLLVQLFTTMNLIFPEVLNLIHAYKAWIDASNKRLEDAQKALEDEKARAVKNQFDEESANIKAFNIGISSAWKIRKDQILEHLTKAMDESLPRDIRDKEFAQIILLTDEVNNKDVNSILFHEEGLPEAKAIKIVTIMRNTRRISDLNKS